MHGRVSAAHNPGNSVLAHCGTGEELGLILGFNGFGLKHGAMPHPLCVQEGEIPLSHFAS